MTAHRPALPLAAVLAAGTAVVVALIAVLARFDPATAHPAGWHTLVVSFSGAGVIVGVVAFVHTAAVGGRSSVRTGRPDLIEDWALAWSAVAAGAEPPSVSAQDRIAASEAAAVVLQVVSCEGATRIRRALVEGGLIAADLGKATHALLSHLDPATIELERLAWIAAPEALPLFEVAAGSSERASRAALLGGLRVLAGERRPEEVGAAVMTMVEEHVATAHDPEATRPFLAAVLHAAEDHLVWLCRNLASRSQHRVVREVASQWLLRRS